MDKDQFDIPSNMLDLIIRWEHMSENEQLTHRLYCTQQYLNWMAAMQIVAEELNLVRTFKR